MSDDAAREDACQEYQSSLEDLTFNSKPHINMLTILAEENLNFAKDIVAIIEAQIAKAPATEKLPVLYLVDSIVKNVGRDYLAAFTKNLVTTFICVFEKVEENTRKSLFKLRSTWDDIFSLKKLYALDVRVNTIDPAWPIKPLPPNVNTSSIHVNPKFLNKPTEEIATPRTSAPQIPATTVASESPKDVSQEQIIRQQLLAKQKQLIELQQKKLELELEQTKAQLAATQYGSTTKSHVIATSPAITVSKSTPQATVQPENTWPVRQHQDAKTYTRDPRLNRSGQQLGQVKDSVVKREGHSQGTTSHQPDKAANVMTEKTSKQEKSKSIKKDTAVSEEKSKSPSPLMKAFQSKGKTVDLENEKLPEINKRDPRLRKHLHEKATDKEEEVKEKKRCLDKERDDPKSSEHRSANTRNKLNGMATKHERNENAEKQDLKSSRSNVKKRSRSPPVLHSPKRKERRSPKRRSSISSSPPPKIGKARQTGVKHPHVEDFGQHTNVREERNPVKKNSVQDPRRPKRAQEERALESRDLHPAKLHPEPKGNTKRWKSGWVENKNSKQTDDHLAHGKPGPLRNRGSSWPNNQRIPALHMPKQHRLSVDANLQIPEELNSANKRDLLKKANKRLSDGEISQEEFLVVAHQIKQLFQYQEEKQRSISWDNTTEETHFATKKKPLLSTPPLQQGDMSDAEISYFEHKAKLRRTQVQHLQDNELMDVTESQDDNYSSDDLHYVKEGQTPPPMAEVLPGQQAPPRYDGQPAPQRYDGQQVQQPLLRFDEAPSQRGQPRFDGPHRRQGQDRFDGSPGPVVHPGFSGPLQGQSGPGRFDGPTVQQTQMRFDGPPGQQGPGRFDPQGRQGPGRFEGPPGQQGPGRFDGSLGQQGPVRFDGPTVQQGSGRFNGPMGPQGPVRFDGPPGQQGPGRFDGPVGQQGSGRFDGPMGSQGPRRFDGPPGQGPMRFDGPMGSQGPRRFDGPPGQGPMRFDGPVGQQGSVRFDGPSGQLGPVRFDGSPMQQGMSRFECPTSQPGPIRFCGPPGHQGPLRPPGPQGLQRFDGPQGQGPPRVDEHSTLCFDNQQPPSSFNMPNLRFSEPSHAYSGAPQPFQGQQNMSQVSNFNGPPGTGGSNFSNPFCRPVAPFFNPGPPVPSIGNMNTVTTSVPVGNIIPQQPVTPESHFGQVDVNDLLSKLLSTGIIKPTQTETPPNETNVPSQTQSVAEEEDDEEQDEDQNIPDLTGFVIEDMKQRYDSVINKLYTGIQCYSCGVRFTTSQTDIYADHLDWHYRQNRSEKDISKKVTHRRWYYSLTVKRAKSQFFEKVHEEVVQKTQEAAKEKEFQSVTAAADVVDESCEICQEQFEMYWEEDEEEWHLKDAIRVDEKTYHPSCYEDYKNTSSFVDCTPSPSTAPLENPLNISVKQEQEQSPCSSVKQETSDASSSCKEETVSEETKVKVEAETQ
ncbi:PCF11 protein, partial [Polyodon spathula]|nr:PCF11 protein [Polyodon spathula]